MHFKTRIEMFCKCISTGLVGLLFYFVDLFLPFIHWSKIDVYIIILYLIANVLQLVLGFEITLGTNNNNIFKFCLNTSAMISVYGGKISEHYFFPVLNSGRKLKKHLFDWHLSTLFMFIETLEKQPCKQKTVYGEN